jgi:outer membrane protein assembly factor BamA
VIAALLAAVLAQELATEGSPYDALVARGVALGREGKLEEARTSLDRAAVLDPSRPEAFVERGGLEFLEKRYPDAIRDLERALALKEDAYARDLLASSLFLAGRGDDALASWNRLGQPVLRRVELRGLQKTRDRVARRELSAAEGQVLELSALRSSRLRLVEAGAFERASLRLAPLGAGKADLEVDLLERHGLYSSPIDFVLSSGVNAINQRVALRYWNMAGTGVSFGGQYRWSENRPEASLVLDAPRPFGAPAYMRLSGFRGRQLYDLEGEQTQRSKGLDLGLRAVLGPKTVGELGWRFRDRTFSHPDPNAPPGLVTGPLLSFRHRLLDVHRQRLDASVRLFQAASGLGAEVAFTQAEASLSYRAHLSAPDGRTLERSLLALRLGAGWGSDAMPLDAMFAVGGSPEMEYPVRGHRQYQDGVLGDEAIGRELVLLNLEWRRRVLSRPTVQVTCVTFLDAASVGRTAQGPGAAYLDVGVGLRVGLPGAGILRLDFGHGLLDGNNALSIGLGQVF